jgi:hypothetical protein
MLQLSTLVVAAFAVPSFCLFQIDVLGTAAMAVTQATWYAVIATALRRPAKKALSLLPLLEIPTHLFGAKDV